MLFLAVVALVMPAVFDLAIYGTLNVASPALDRLSFSTRTRADRGVRRQPDLLLHRAARSVPAGRRVRAPRRPPAARAPRSVCWPIGTVLTTVQAEILVGAMQPALARFGLTELFVGVIVVALIGNAAEHYSA
jgi:Ca2+:H+ antiporter